jgi:hypothetical protein
MDPATSPDRFAESVDVLCRLIARHGHLRRLAGPLIVLIWGRVRTIGTEVAAVLARMRAGRLRRYPARRPPRLGAAPRRPATRSALPHSRAWLVALIPETAASGAQLQALLAEPELAALLESAPQLRRTLRPLCRMLGVKLPPPPPRPRDAALGPPDQPPDPPPNAPIAPGAPPEPARHAAAPPAPLRPATPPRRQPHASPPSHKIAYPPPHLHPPRTPPPPPRRERAILARRLEAGGRVPMVDAGNPGRGA